MWRAVYDSTEGTSHIEDGLPCQDACRVATVGAHDGTTFLVAVCADGAGSATHAHEGARLVCDQFVERVSALLQSGNLGSDGDREASVSWCRDVRDAVRARAEELQVPVRELASTLLAAVIGESSAMFLQIGDGAMVVGDGSSHEVVFWPQSGEYANTTNFITDDDFDESLEFCVRTTPIEEFAAFTDGLERLILKFTDRTVHSPSLAPMFNTIHETDDVAMLFQPLHDFITSERVNQRTNDDKTLILAVRDKGHADANELS